MSEAVLRIRTAGGAEVEALLDRIDRAAGRSRARRARGAQESAQREAAHYRQSGQQIERADQLVTRARLRELALQDAAQRRFAALYVEMHKRATAVIEAEVGKRGDLTEREKRQVEQLALAMVASHEHAERERTASTQRATARREAVEKASMRRIQATIRTVASHAAQAADAIHNAVQAPREQRAAANRVLGNALRGAGSTDAADMTRAQERIDRFVDQTGMRYGDVTEALAEGQRRGSVLDPRDGQTREQALETALETIRMANAEDSTPGQVLAARGRLREAGLTGDNLEAALRRTIRFAQAGQVEVDQAIQQGLPGASSLMTQRAAALGPGATDAQRQEAMLRAYTESMALQEVAAAAGRQPGNTANTLARLNEFVRTPRRQEMILTNIRSAERGLNTRTPEGAQRAQRLRELYEGDNALFERDPMRRGNAMRLREDVDPATLAVRLSAAMGGDVTGVMGLLAGSGHGNAQSLLANQRGLLGFIGARMGRINEMQKLEGISETTLTEHQRQVEGDELSTINRAREAGVRNVRAPGAFQRGSDLIAEREASNPLFYNLARGIPVVGPLAIGISGAILGAAGEGPSSGPPRGGRGAGMPAPSGGPVPVSLAAADHTAIGNATAAALQRTPLQTTVSPNDLVHYDMTSRHGSREAD